MCARSVGGLQTRTRTRVGEETRYSLVEHLEVVGILLLEGHDLLEALLVPKTTQDTRIESRVRVCAGVRADTSAFVLHTNMLSQIAVPTTCTNVQVYQHHRQ